MQSKTFGALLSRLNSVVEQLAKAHDDEVEEALWSVRIGGQFPDDEDHGDIKVILNDNLKREAAPSAEKSKHMCGTASTGTTGSTSVCEQGPSMWDQGANSLVAGELTVASTFPPSSKVCIAKTSETGHQPAGFMEYDFVEDVDDHTRGGPDDDSNEPTYLLAVDTGVQSRLAADTGPSIVKHTSSMAARFFQYRMRRPWSDFKEFDDIKISHELTTLMLQSRITKKFSAIVSKRDLIKRQKVTRFSCVSWLISHPDSIGRSLWTLACMILLLYDFFLVPVDICFELERTRFTFCMNYGTTIFWTIDIVYSFLTGVHTKTHVEMRLSQIARIYARSYLLFDVSLVSLEWVTLAVESFDSGASVVMLRVLRWGRFTRLWRVARIMRILRQIPFLRQVMFHLHVSTLYARMTQGWMGLCMLYFIVMHLLACAWYAFGNALDRGWVHTNDLGSSSVMRAYVISLHWCVSRPYGLTSSNRLETPIEVVVDAVLVFGSLTFVTFYIGRVTAASISKASSGTADLWKYAVAYVRRHDISREVDMRLVKVLEAFHCGGAGEIEVEENKLLQSLPVSLKEDLLFEARVRHLMAKPFLRDMYLVNERVVRHVTTKAIFPLISVEREVLFAYGDACESVLFVTGGCLWYAYHISPNEVLEEAAMGATPSRSWGLTMSDEQSDYLSEPSYAGTIGTAAWQRTYSSAEGEIQGSKMLVRNAVISEPVLWTVWEHSGSLLAAEETTSLSLDATKFSEVVLQHTSTCMHMVKYAKHFVWNLNHSESIVNDLTEFPDLNISNLDEELGISDEHFMFISHYKVEAGTEATLMRESLEPILQEDLRHPANDFRAPIFIDSEDLVDLATLKAHVEMSKVLVLLLTPGVLSRPWCLIEIVTATRKGVNIVPVEIQRPGSKYQYPDEDFYVQILSGQMMNEEAMGLLEQEQVSLLDVEQAIRQVFLKISLPFSPHKTKTVREAELHDILKRCNADLGVNLKRASVVKRASFADSV